MSKTKKKILFYSLFASFFLVGYFALLFAFGFAYDFESGKFVKTGSIYVSTNVSAKVKIGEGKPKDTGLLRNDATKKYLLPDEYDIDVTKQGYSNWHKTADVPAGLVAAFQNIILVPEDLKAVTLLPTIQDISFSDNGKYLFYKDVVNKYGIVELKDPKIEPSDDRLTNSLNIVSWDEENKNIFLSNFAASRIIGGSERIIPVPVSLLNRTLVLADDYLISLSNRNILIYDHKQGVFEETIRSASSFAVNEKDIYYINSEDNLLYKFDLDDKSNVLVSGADNFTGGTILKAKLINNNLYISVKGGSLSHLFKVNSEEIILIASNITDFRLSHDKEKIVWWNSFGAWVHWVKDTKVQPFKAAGESERILAASGIKSVSWHKQNNYLIVFTNRNIIFAETDTRFETNTVILFDSVKDSDTGFVRSIQEGIYNPDSNNIYFLAGSELKRISLEK